MPRKPASDFWPLACAHPDALPGHTALGTYRDTLVVGDDDDAEVSLIWVCRDHATKRRVPCDHTGASPGRPCPYCFFRHD